ncbi:hypothetical protein CXG81DRAFT_8583 [Caulochytrium protostelioides]|uniref:Sodium/calcium exchanger membrane region domain-containing protein n=1 Tax=Caulochytrium protostelioides TaxID=1555241 RepID=A0A4P9XFA3_9FUNG|nr:hypothetical protein CXG81DRAFT_8583 [Caulochytrium protostelioides]|eukprot:RKP04244.1 hypothetical protein CXG81DRAFT_8583 [Caulochytrium protostelioides]
MVPYASTVGRRGGDPSGDDGDYHAGASDQEEEDGHDLDDDDDDDDDDEDDEDDDDDDDDHADEAEEGVPVEDPQTVKERQEAINVVHPFGLKLWKPALYKKNRSIQQQIYSALHSVPGARADRDLYLSIGNIGWLFAFGWWIAILYLVVGVVGMGPPWLLGRIGLLYMDVMFNLALYIMWPFGKFIIKRRSYGPDPLDRLDVDRLPLDPTALMGHGAHDHDGAAGTAGDVSATRGAAELMSPGLPLADDTSAFGGPSFLNPETLTRRVGRQGPAWVPGVLRRLWHAGLAGLLFRLWLLFLLAPVHLAVTGFGFFFVFPIPIGKLNYVLLKHLLRHPLQITAYSITDVPKLCDPAHSEYYTVYGVNIVFINFLAVVFFTLADFYYIGPTFGYTGIAANTFIFMSGLVSVIPLAYFIGQAVASITAQTGSMALGAVVNATFGSLIEIVLYALALMEGKNALVDGAVIGSFLTGLLALPGASMIGGGTREKEQTFNSKAASVTSTMLMLSLVGAFSPSIFQHVYGTYVYSCRDYLPGSPGCPSEYHPPMPQHPRVEPVLAPPITPYGWLGDMAAATGDATCRICRLTQLTPRQDPVYQRHTLPLIQIASMLMVVVYIIGLIFMLKTHAGPASRDSVCAAAADDGAAANAHGHDSPNWSMTMSAVVLIACTVLYSAIAEVLIACLDGVLEGSAVDAKFLGLTLFAIVPTVTEFCNAIAFARAGNISLAMEIGSEYTVQVSLLQIPALVAFSAWWSKHGHTWWAGRAAALPSSASAAATAMAKHTLATFDLVFPRWDTYTVFIGVLLVTYVFNEGTANYFKGSILLGAYLILVAGFYFEP